MSPFNSSFQFTANLGRLPLAALRSAVVLALALFAQGAMAQDSEPAPVKPRAAKVDRTGDAPASTPAAKPVKPIAAEVKTTEAAPAAAPERAAQAGEVTPEPAAAPQAVAPAPAAPRSTGAAAPELTQPRVPLPSELRGAAKREREQARTEAVDPSTLQHSTPVAPAPEVQQP